MARITDKQITNLKAGVWLSESLGRGEGTFLARRIKEGGAVAYYFRHTLPDGKRDTLRMSGNLSLKDARAEAKRLSGFAYHHPHLREWLDEQQFLEAEALRRERIEREQCTLAALLDGYVAWLERQGKYSVKLVRASIKRDVLDAWPELAASKAASLTRRDLGKIVAKVVAEGHGRQAAKLRAYLRAAYAAALRAETDPSIPPELHGFNLDTNPAADLASLSQFNQVRNTALNLPELQAVWKGMQSLGGVSGAGLRLCLLLGGQRPTQLLRLKTADLDFHSGLLVLHDPKGRRNQAREHVLPITDAVRRELEPLMALHAGGYVLSSTGGTKPMREETLAACFRENIVKPLVASGDVSKMVRFGDLRRSVETLLASMQTTEKTRAQLQSHGLGGIQSRHYDMHDYLNEKRRALALLESLLAGQDSASNVVLLSPRANMAEKSSS